MDTQNNFNESLHSPTRGGQQREIVKLRESLYQALGDESGIDISVKDGTVWLTGVVDDSATRDWAVETVRKTNGVEDVVNNLTVKVIV